MVDQALKSSEEHYRELYDHNPTMYFTVDPRGIVLSVNQFGADQLGYSPQELVGKPVLKVFHKDDRKAVGDQLKKFINASEDIIHWEYRKVRKDGSVLWVKETAHLVRKSKSDVVIFIVCEDITDRKQAELALHKAHEELEIRVKERTLELTRALTELETFKNRLQEENVNLKKELALGYSFGKILTNSPTFQKLLQKAEQVAETNATVLILGETGTGKDLLAKAIHNLSPRKGQALVKVDCGTLPAPLIESVLFGHEKGAFTGAISQNKGRFEIADGGTIFLDEIGELPLDLQSKLLTILQEGEFTRLGNAKTIQVDVRVIAATNRNLKRAVEEGRFREDLYYRLNVFPLQIPPLRERKVDIPLLVKHFTEEFSARMGKKIHTIPKEALKAMTRYEWPGNIRELENLVERVIILSEGSTLDLEEVYLSLQERLPKKMENLTTVKEMERSLILQALKNSNWVIQGKNGAANKLDMAPSTVRDRVRRYRIERPKKK